MLNTQKTESFLQKFSTNVELTNTQLPVSLTKVEREVNINYALSQERMIRTLSLNILKRKLSNKEMILAVIFVFCIGIAATIFYQNQIKHITLITPDQESKITTMKSTVADILHEYQIVLGESDRVIPGTQEKLTDDLIITVYYGVSYTLTIDGTTNKGESSALTVQDLLQELALEVREFDRVLPEPSTQLTENLEISVIRVRQELVSESVVIPFATTSIPRNDLHAGYQKVIVSGSDGLIVNTYLVVSEDGVIVNKQLQSTEEKATVINQIVEYGTQVHLANGDELSSYKTANMSTTGYCSCYICCGKNPGDYGYGLTASGLAQGYGVVGVDTSVIPFGTKLYIEGYGYAVAGDTGGAIFPTHLDLGFYTHADAVAWGRKDAVVYFLND